MIDTSEARIRRWQLIVAGTLLAILHTVVIVRLFFMPDDRIDLQIILDAVSRLRLGEMLYRPEIYNEHTKPPLTTFLLWALGGIPYDWVRRVWDLLNLTLPALLGWSLLRSLGLSARARVWALALALTMAISSWFWEAQLGQYNLILLAFLLLFSSLEEARPGMARSFALGAALGLVILIKPTNVLYLPWCVVGKRRSRWLAVMLGCVAVPGLLAIAYAEKFGAARLVSDHQLWWRVLAITTAKHIGRSDNMGLAVLGGGSLRWLLIGLGLSTLCVARWKQRAPLWVLGAVGWLSIATSSMGWFQNFVLLLPVYLIVCAETLKGDRGWFWLAIGLEVGGAILQPQLVGRPAFALLGMFKLWLWLPMLGLWLTRPREQEEPAISSDAAAEVLA